MSLQRYVPQPVLLPVDSQITRTFYDQRSHLPGKPPLTQADYEGFETHTILHDVFLNADGKHLSAIGPPLVNLKTHLFPISVEIVLDGKRIVLRHRQLNRDRVTFHRFKLPKALHDTDELATIWQFANGQRESIVARRQRLPAVDLQIATLQKNNKVEWILDWLRYYKSYGVQRVLLYDNGSDNFSQFGATLEKARGLPDIVLIHWPYPYGPKRSFYNKFCQAGQNNHAYQCFGQSKWTGHFDVDEYLVIRSGRSIASILKDAPGHWGLVRFDSYWVSDVEDKLSHLPDNQLPTVRDFKYRDLHARGKAHKYIVRNQRVKMANTHNARVTLGLKRKGIPASEMAFFHYKSLTNDWRGFGKRDSAEPLSEDKHVKDDAVQERMKSIDNSISNKIL